MFFLRPSFGFTLGAGAGLPEIMDRLGHADDETTTKIYLHVTKAKKKETSQKFSELMKSL